MRYERVYKMTDRFRIMEKGELIATEQSSRISGYKFSGVMMLFAFFAAQTFVLYTTIDTIKHKGWGIHIVMIVAVSLFGFCLLIPAKKFLTLKKVQLFENGIQIPKGLDHTESKTDKFYLFKDIRKTNIRTIPTIWKPIRRLTLETNLGEIKIFDYYSGYALFEKVTDMIKKNNIPIDEDYPMIHKVDF